MPSIPERNEPTNTGENNFPGGQKTLLSHGINTCIVLLSMSVLLVLGRCWCICYHAKAVLYAYRLFSPSLLYIGYQSIALAHHDRRVVCTYTIPLPYLSLIFTKASCNEDAFWRASLQCKCWMQHVLMAGQHLFLIIIVIYIAAKKTGLRLLKVLIALRRILQFQFHVLLIDVVTEVVHCCCDADRCCWRRKLVNWHETQRAHRVLNS